MDRNQLIKKYGRLVKIIASKIAHRLPPNVELDDLISAGTLGLIDAIDKFDRSKSDNFKKYAEIRIKGAILDELRSLDHVSRTVRRQTTSLERTRKEMRQNLGRQPTDEEVAEVLGTTVQDYHQMLDKLKPILVVGFDDLGGGGDDGDARDPLQFLPDPAAVDPRDVLQGKMLRELVEEVLGRLKERERIVVSLYYYDDLNLKEIGKVLGVTESRISQILKEATGRLRRRVRMHFSSRHDTTPQLVA